MTRSLKLIVVAVALLVSGVLVSPSAQVSIQRGWNVVSGYMDIVGTSATYKWVVSGTSLLLQSSTGGAFSTVGTFTSGGAFTAVGEVQANSIGVGVAPSGSAGIFETVASGYIGWKTRSYLRSSSDGNVRVLNNVETNSYDITLADWGTTLSAESVSIAQNGVELLGTAPLGYLTVVVGTDNRSCMFAMRGSSNAVTDLPALDIDGQCSATKDTVNNINVYYDAAGASGAGYYLQNTRAGTVTIRKTLIGA